jgi:hypothetical protein
MHTGMCRQLGFDSAPAYCPVACLLPLLLLPAAVAYGLQAAAVWLHQQRGRVHRHDCRTQGKPVSISVSYSLRHRHLLGSSFYSNHMQPDEVFGSLEHLESP